MNNETSSPEASASRLQYSDAERAAHTPGPWFYSRRRKSIWRSDGDEANSNHVRIAQHIHNPHDGDLMTAALDMRAALEQIEKGLRDTGSIPLKRMTLMTKSDAHAIASAALAKAGASHD